MSLFKFIFRVLDVFGYPFQNYKHYKGMKTIKNIVYDPANPKDCRGDVVFDPELIKTKKLPVVVNIHGGGFQAGDKCCRQSLSERFASEGYFVFNINYTLSPKSHFPNSVYDVVNGYNYIEELAKTYNIDLTKVCVTGDSAGGYMAAMVTAISFSEDLREHISAPQITYKPSVFVGGCGVYDLVQSITLVDFPFNYVWNIGHNFLDNETFKLKKDMSNIDELSYLPYVSPAAFVNENWCPTFLIISKIDSFAKGQGELLNDILEKTNIPHDSYTSEKQNHCFHLTFSLKDSKKLYPQMFEFMKKYLQD